MALAVYPACVKRASVTGTPCVTRRARRLTACSRIVVARSANADVLGGIGERAERRVRVERRAFGMVLVP